MLKIYNIICYILLLFNFRFSNSINIITKDAEYKPNWNSLDSRPTPDWFDEAKIGIFIHWGVFSVPTFGTEWFWYYWKGPRPKDDYVNFMNKNYAPAFTYQDFGSMFTAELFDAKEWSKLFENSGARYVVLTSKHHEGFTLWPSKYSYSWNSIDIGPHRDIVGELAQAIKNNTNLKFGLYHSLFEWFNPLYQSDKKHNWTTNYFVRKKTIPELYELVKLYEPQIIWSDGEAEASADYWQSKEFLTWLFNESPVRDSVAVNDRWGTGTSCQHGGYYTCADRYNPGVLNKHKWENAMTLDTGSWGYRADASFADYMTSQELIKQIVTTISCGGNILINVGPTKEGTIIPIFQERLLEMGNWLSINGEAIYKSKPWFVQNDTISNFVWYTCRPDLNAVYGIFLKWPDSELLELGYSDKLYNENTKIILLNNANINLEWSVKDDIVEINLPSISRVYSKWAWTIKIINLNL